MVQQGSIEVGPPAAQGEGRARRYYKTVDALVERPVPEVKVVADILTYAVKRYGNAEAIGWRETIRMVKEEKEVMKDGVAQKKEWLFFELGPYQWWSVVEMAKAVGEVGSALVASGHSKETVFNIYSATNPRWQVMANACASQSVTFATAYDSLGEEGLEHSLNEPSVYGMFTNANLLGMLAAVINRTPTLKVLIYDGPADAIKKGALETIGAANGGIKIYTFDEFLALGQKTPAKPNHPQPEDVATVMYTSGSTGPPKGVLLTNANIIASIAGLDVLMGDQLRGGTYLAYLPLAHILEFTFEMSALFLGVKIGYGTVKTLTDASVRNCAGDIRTLRPTILAGVPAVWELIRKGIVTKVKAAGGVSAALFNFAVHAKRYTGTRGILGKILDAVVLKKVKDATGGRLQFAINGGAPLSVTTQEFLSNVLTEVLAGYGMTESTALTTVLTPEFFQYGSVGVPVPSCEIKLVDFAEAGYFSSNTRPQGEVWIRGPSVSYGYFKRPDLTAESMTADGWMQTGDIGQWGPDGTLSLIDRKKNLIKLSGGEYVALERLESVYKTSNLVTAICVHASSNANKPMAIIFPQEAALRALAGKDAVDFDKLCEDPEVVKAVLAELNAIGKQEGLKPLETLQTVILSSIEWTAANGLLTAAQKLQRRAIIAEFKTKIDAVYP